MKKIIALFLTTLFLLTFTACSDSKEEVTLTVLVESSSSLSNGLNETLTETLKLENNITLEFITIDSDSSTNRNDREMELQSVRTEVMSGKGADIYILPTALASRHEALFVDLNETMENGLFLTLDDYIAESEVINTEDYIPAVLDAGKTKEGQQVIPLLYTVPAMFTDSDIPHSTMSLNEIFRSADADLLMDVQRLLTDSQVGIWLFPQVADYADFKLAVNEDDIRSAFDKMSGFSSTGAFFEAQLFNEDTLYDYNERSLVLLENNNGGVTAKALAFAAIDRNCEHPEKAFEVLELICGYASHGEKSLRPDPELYGAAEGLASLRGYLTEKDMVDLEMVSFIENNISDVSFNSNLDEVLYRAYMAYKPKDPSFDKDKYITDTYTELKMHLAE